jgi:PERQ amino acid-rich with GYF domain-containing protein
MKPPPPNAPKDTAAGGAGARKTSVSHSQNHMNTFNTSSPSSSRPGTRRRETADSVNNPISPTAGTSRFFRDEPNTTTPPPSLLRRKTDFRDSSSSTKSEDKDREKEGMGRDIAGEASAPFGSLKRSATNPLVTGLTRSTSPWPSASHNASFSPMGTFGSFSLPTHSQTNSTDKRPGFSSVRGESRFKGLLSKDSSEDVSVSIKEKSSQRSLEKLSENEGDGQSESSWSEPVKTRDARSETNPFREETCSGNTQDIGTSSQGMDQGIDQLGLSAFGMTPSVPGFRELMQSHDNSHEIPNHLQGLEPISPTNTNPYQSPRGEKVDDDVDTDGSDIQHTHLPGLSGLHDNSNAAPYGPIRRGGSGLDITTGDRSQTSSTGPSRSFSGFGGLGGVSSLGGAGGWSPNGPLGTPTRERAGFPGFSDGIFSTVADLQSPSLPTLGGSFLGPQGGLTGSGSIGRASKMGALFSPLLQEQMHGDQSRQDSVSVETAVRQPGESTYQSGTGEGLLEIDTPVQSFSFSKSTRNAIPNSELLLICERYSRCRQTKPDESACVYVIVTLCIG